MEEDVYFFWDAEATQKNFKWALWEKAEFIYASGYLVQRASLGRHGTRGPLLSLRAGHR